MVVSDALGVLFYISLYSSIIQLFSFNALLNKIFEVVENDIQIKIKVYYMSKSQSLQLNASIQ